MPEKTDVIIIGGGVIGCSVAYHLALAGLRATVVERDAIGSQASGMAAGLLVPLGESPAPKNPVLRLGLESLEMHRELAPRLQEETGIDVGLRNTPLLLPAFTEEEVAELRGRLSWQAELGLDIRWVDGPEARRWEPALAPEALGALLSRAEAQLEPYPLVLALAQAVEKRGTTFRYREVSGLRRLPGGDLEVQAGADTLLSQQVVLAMGPWVTEAEAWLGRPFPVRPQRGQLLQLATGQPPLQAIVMHRSSYVAPKADDITIVGATEEDDVGFERRATPEGTRSVIEGAVRLAPVVKNFRLVQALAGLRPLSADGLPILGPVPGWEGVYVAAGHGRKGVLLSAVTGRLLADWVTGAPLSVDAAPFLASRFEGEGA